MKALNAYNGLLLCLALVFFSSQSHGQLRSGKLGIGAGGSMYLFNSNIDDGRYKFGGGMNVTYSVMEHLGVRLMLGSGQLGWKDAAGFSYTTDLMSANGYLSLDIIPHGSFNPFIFAGVGGIYFDPHSDDGVYNTGFDKIDINYLVGAGFDIFFNEFVSVTVSGEAAFSNTDKLDFPKSVGKNEMYSRVNLELKYYFFDQNYITKLIEALQDRYKKK